MEDPRKPVVNTVTIRLDVRETDGGNKSGRDEGEVRKMEKEEGRGRKSGGRRSHVFLRSRSTWFVRASMWANNAHFGSNRDALHSVHYSVHVSMWPGRGRGYTLPPSLLERCQQHRVARNYPCLDGTRRRVLQRTGHCWKTARVPLLEIRYAASSVESHGATCVLERWWSRGKPLEPDGEGFGWPNFWLPASRRNPPPHPPPLSSSPRFLPSYSHARSRFHGVIPGSSWLEEDRMRE